MSSGTDLRLVDRLADETVDVVALLAIVGIAVATDPSTIEIASIVAIATGRRGLKGLSSLAGS